MSLVQVLLEQFSDEEDLKDLNEIDRDYIIYSLLKRKARKKFKQLSSGTGREVYDYKDNMVIKLAKNAKGIAQNEAEYSLGREPYIDDVVANVFYGAENFSFLISEKAQPITVSEFERIAEVKWKYFEYYIVWWGNELVGKTDYPIEDEEARQVIRKELEDGNEVVQKFVRFIADYGMGDVVGDLARRSSYGIVNRDYGEDIVLIDYGLTKEIYDKHYK